MEACRARSTWVIAPARKPVVSNRKPTIRHVQRTTTRPQEIPPRYPNDIAEYRRNIAGVEVLHCRELLLQSDQLITKAKIFCVPTAIFGRAGLLDLALMKRTPRAQMG